MIRYEEGLFARLYSSGLKSASDEGVPPSSGTLTCKWTLTCNVARYRASPPNLYVHRGTKAPAKRKGQPHQCKGDTDGIHTA